MASDMTENVPDDLPIALRRKRRGSTVLPDPAIKIDRETGNFHQNNVEAKTPTKAKKRVRFSEPALDPSSSSGLTPYLKRSTLTPKSSSSVSKPLLLSQAPRRRRSFPSNLSSSLPSPSLSPPPTPLMSGEVQFAPFYQILNPRLKRRLRRNHISEEFNKIVEEKRSRSQLEREVQDLKHEIEARTERSEQLQELEEQLISLKEEMRERSTTVDPPLAFADSDRTTPNSTGFGDGDADDDFLMLNFDDNGAVRYKENAEPTALNLDATTQVSLPSQDHAAAFRSARMALEYLFPGEISLGLDTEDPGPMLDTMLDRIRHLKTNAHIAQKDISLWKDQAANLRNQFNAVLQQIQRARDYAETLNTELTQERARARQAEGRIQALEISATRDTERVKELEDDLDEKYRSIHKLQDALETYRSEVGKLEVFVTRLEGEHSDAMSSLRSEMDETAADLQCHVAAEVTGRRAAEKEAVERGERIQQLEQMEVELKGAMSEKQKIIRGLEKQLADEKEGSKKELDIDKEKWEEEVGVLNVKIDKMASKIAELRSQLSTVEGEKERLTTLTLRVIAAGQASAARLGEDMRAFGETVAKSEQSRGVEVAEHRGLLTPVSVCKFRDLGDFVLIERPGAKDRRRPDSGIGILEEEDLENVEDAEV